MDSFQNKNISTNNIRLNAATRQIINITHLVGTVKVGSSISNNENQNHSNVWFNAKSLAVFGEMVEKSKILEEKGSAD